MGFLIRIRKFVRYYDYGYEARVAIVQGRPVMKRGPHQTNHRTCAHQWATTRKGGPIYAECVKCHDKRVWSFSGEGTK